MAKSIKKQIFEPVSSQKIIYIYRINDKKHEGLLKIGDATNHNEILPVGAENSVGNIKFQQMWDSAIKRIKQQGVVTEGVSPQLLYTCVAIDKDNKGFRDKQVHSVLKASNIKMIPFEYEKSFSQEWFKVDLQTAINAVKAVINKQHSLAGTKITKNKNPIVLKSFQQDCVNETIKRLKQPSVSRFLWNCKPRFGKTITCHEFIRRMGYEKVLIFTNRPVVNDGWEKDFHKVWDSDTTVKIQYGSKKSEGIKSLATLLADYNKDKTRFLYFASLQDIRGSQAVGGNYAKYTNTNDNLWEIDWDLVVIDEAHEGITTELGSNVVQALQKPKTKFLYLSGTPFKISSDFPEEDTFAWTYSDERQIIEKAEQYGAENPCAGSPKLNIFTYNLSEDIEDIDTSTKFFNFREFFKTYTGNLEIDGKIKPKDKNIGDFVYEEKVKKFIHLLEKPDLESNYPFAIQSYRDMFRHTFWIIPGVKEAKALSKLLKENEYFGKNYDIINVAGEGDEDAENEESLKMVQNAIAKGTRGTITLSCGRLTTGVTVPEWSAVLYLAGSKNTSIQNYIQTIFRVQNPCEFPDGTLKENCFVFDFAPDRVLEVVPALARIESKNLYITSTDDSNREQLKQLLNFMPVIAVNGSKTIPYDVDSMMQEVKRVTALKVVQEGFDCDELYNMNLLLKDKINIKDFEKLRAIIGTSNKETMKPIIINAQGLTESELKTAAKLKKKNKQKLTPEQEKIKEKLREQEKQKKTMISVLRGMTVRIPLLIYGLDGSFKEDIDLDKFSSQIDDESFKEFMPTGLTKEMFDKFVKYFDRDVFNAAVNELRQRIIACDSLPPLQRIYEISQIFSTFRNPDKETVLTPWRVVNKQMEFTLGGYQLYTDDMVDWNTYEPKFINNGEETKDTLLNINSKILDINSKTGLYSLYCAYSIYRKRLEGLGSDEERVNKELQKQLWYMTIQENIYCICKTQMARIITLRTLCGFDINVIKQKNLKYNIVYKGQYSANAQFYPDYVEACKSDPQKVADQITDPDFWKKD